MTHHCKTFLPVSQAEEIFDVEEEEMEVPDDSDEEAIGLLVDASEEERDDPAQEAIGEAADSEADEEPGNVDAGKFI